MKNQLTPAERANMDRVYARLNGKPGLRLTGYSADGAVYEMVEIPLLRSSKSARNAARRYLRRLRSQAVVSHTIIQVRYGA